MSYRQLSVQTVLYNA